jgi:dTDP-4-dehydrorhamnose reductase
MRVVVTGAGGQLGAAIAHACAGEHHVAAFNRRELDVGDEAAVAAALDRARPDLIVNGAAFTNVDAAEEDPVAALSVNAFGPRALARAAERRGAILVHYSTDFVFDGGAASPYRETDRPNPQNTYAASKLLGEWFALDTPRAYVLRVETLFGSTPGGPEPRGSVAGILNALVDGRSAPVFIDRTISPTYIPDAVRATLHLVASSAPFGLYHCVNSGSCTWIEFAQELARQMRVQPNFVPVRMQDVTLKAKRPQYCALSNDKLRAAGADMPPWQDALSRFLMERQTIKR